MLIPIMLILVLIFFVVIVVLASHLVWPWLPIVQSSEFSDKAAAIFMAFTALATLSLALATFYMIRQNRLQASSDKKIDLIDEIVQWQTEVNAMLHRQELLYLFPPASPLESHISNFAAIKDVVFKGSFIRKTTAKVFGAPLATAIEEHLADLNLFRLSITMRVLSKKEELQKTIDRFDYGDKALYERFVVVFEQVEKDYEKAVDELKTLVESSRNKLTNLCAEVKSELVTH